MAEKNLDLPLKEGHPLKDLEKADAPIEKKEQNPTSKESNPSKSKEKNLSAYDKLSDQQKIIFLAGVFDGEGSFGLWGHGPGRPKRMKTAVETSDQDMVARFKDFFGGSMYPLKNRDPGKRKDLWRWASEGNKAYNILEIMIPYMCLRRKEKFYGLVKPSEHGSKDRGSHLQKQTRLKKVVK